MDELLHCTAMYPCVHTRDVDRGTRVRVQVGFISGIPANLRVNGAAMSIVEINFLCVHKKLRSKRLTPLLIKEVTRRVNLHGIWQAAYTAGVVIPKPVATCRYYHRSINPKKLVEVGFSSLNARTTMVRMIKLNKLPVAPQTPGAKPTGCYCCFAFILRLGSTKAVHVWLTLNQYFLVTRRDGEAGHTRGLSRGLHNSHDVGWTAQGGGIHACRLPFNSRCGLQRSHAPPQRVPPPVQVAPALRRGRRAALSHAKGGTRVCLRRRGS